MTTIYFVRHAEPNYSNHDDLTRELTERGRMDSLLVTRFLLDKNVEAIFSSPYRRAVETILDLANRLDLEIHRVENFRERRVGGSWIEDYSGFARRQWADFDYKLPDGESLREVQERNIAALAEVLTDYAGKTVVIGSHGTALSTVIHYYNPAFHYADFDRIRDVMPWVVKLTFDGFQCVAIEEINLSA